ncbi:Hypothetical protein CINCED_3A014143 [Cinara cedri]|uniref:Uncharacterized protein n=1 Tax=Cinara cedri TaxID=506608 RepID=A0A5E4M6K0_9HEMI|nr:Hypothetical protein CINCED_3A014143 [Cinara cedri]
MQSKCKTSRGGCCRGERKMVKCAATAIEKMKDMFGTAVCTLDDPSGKPPIATSGCVMDAKCQMLGCPFRGTGVAPNVLQGLCEKPLEGNGRTDQNAMVLLPGEVGLRGDRATFYLGSSDGQTAPIPDDSQSAGAVYYNIRPTQPPATVTAGRGPAKSVIPPNPPKPRKHVMQMLPVLPKSTKPAVGPVTGLPISEDEHVFVIRLGKRHNEPDEKARLQIEMRMPKIKIPVTTEVPSQYMESDLLPAVSSGDKDGGKGKKKGKK